MTVSGVKKLLSSIAFSVIFIVGGFGVIWIFDKMNLSLNLDNSGFLGKMIDLNWFHFFSRPVLNGVFTLIVIIGILMVVFRLAKLLSPKR